MLSKQLYHRQLREKYRTNHFHHHLIPLIFFPKKTPNMDDYFLYNVYFIIRYTIKYVKILEC